MVHRTPKVSSAGGMSVRHPVSEKHGDGKVQGKLCIEALTVVIHRRCYGRSGMRKEIGWGLIASLRICIYFGHNRKTLTVFKE